MKSRNFPIGAIFCEKKSPFSISGQEMAISAMHHSVSLCVIALKRKVGREVINAVGAGFWQ
jgi:hypothetical protein